jgi:tetratricopeptide (TPR) repeat protein
MLGHMHLMKREYDEALAVSEQALDERPSCQAAFGLHANILNYCARPEEAIPLAQKAIRLTPVAQPWFPEVLSTAHYLSGDLEEAIATAHQALALAPDCVYARVALVAALAETGRLDSARSESREILSIQPGFSLQHSLASRPYRDAAVLTRFEKALRQVGLPDSGESGLARVYALAPPGDASRRRVAPRPRRS